MDIVTTMIEAPLTFFQGKEEESFADAAKFGEAEFGVAPETFDTVDVVSAASEFVLVVVDAMVLETFHQDAIISFPSVGGNVAFFEDGSLQDRHPFSAGAVFDHAQENPPAALVESQDRNLSFRSAPSFSSNAATTIAYNFSAHSPKLTKKSARNTFPTHQRSFAKSLTAIFSSADA